MKKYIIFIFLILILNSFFFVQHIYAITETSGDLQVIYEKPLFPSTIIWYPGLTVQKTFTVKNIGRSTHTTSIKTNNTSQTSVLANNMFFKINEGVIELYGKGNNKMMKNFWDNGETNLSDVSGGSTITYLITITMPAELKNDFQEKNAKFDLVVGFVDTPSQVIITKPASTIIVPIVSSSGQVKGESVKQQPRVNFNRIIILILLILLLIFSVILFWKRKKQAGTL